MGMIERLLCWLLPYQDIYETTEDGTQKLYLRRWFLKGQDDSDWKLEDRTSRVVIHKMYRSDSGRLPHTHPFWFKTLVLFGGYVDKQYSWDKTNGPASKWRKGPMLEDMTPGTFRHRDASHLHQVQLKDGKPSWTLVWMGKPTDGGWGFVDRNGEYMDRKEYKKAGGDLK